MELHVIVLICIQEPDEMASLDNLDDYMMKLYDSMEDKVHL